MKKTLKILSIVLLSIAMLFAFAQPVSLARNVDSVIGGVENGGKDLDSGINSLAATIINWIWGISIIVAIIVVMVIGIKFIIGGTQEKAKYKESLMPVAVGVILVVFATTIVRFLFSIN